MEQEKASEASITWPTMEVFDYCAEACNILSWDFSASSQLDSLADIPENHVRWINIDGPCCEALLNKIGNAFQIHPLVIHNISNNIQRTKVEEYNNLLSIVTKMIYYSGDDLVIEHTNILIGRNYVLTLGERKGDVFQNIRRRIQSYDRVRSLGADYLAYLLLDAIVDGYFEVLDTIGEQIDALEDCIMDQTDKQHLLQIRTIKKILLQFNRYIWPLRNVAALLDKDSSTIIHPATEPYMRDVYNHIVQVNDSTTTYLDLLSGLADLHFANISYRMNEIMKVLTIISTIFIPLTFIVGVYGMNFKYMPELSQPWGYPVTWIVMAAISMVMILFFRRKKWF